MRRRRDDETGAQEIAELAALADGSLMPERRAALEARVAESSELADLLAEQQRAVAFARGAAAEVEAPPALRARVEGQRRVRRLRAPSGLVLTGAIATVAVAVAVAVVVLRSGSSGERLQAALAPTNLARGATGEATLTKTSSADRAARDGTPPSRRRALL